jgi:hypothetical protein
MPLVGGLSVHGASHTGMREVAGFTVEFPAFY